MPEAKVEAFALLLIFFWNKCLPLLLGNWLDLGVAFAGLFYTYSKEMWPLPLLSEPFRHQMGTYSLKSSLKLNNWPIVTRPHEKWPLFIRPDELLNVFPLLTADVSVRVGTVNQGVHLFEFWFLTEQNKHLRGLWMRKVRAHSTHEKLIYSPPSPTKTPPREKRWEKKKQNTNLLNKWASQVGQAWPVLLTLEWINYLYFEGLKQSVGFLREPTRVPSSGVVGLIPYTSPVVQKQLPKRLIFMLTFFQ